MDAQDKVRMGRRKMGRRREHMLMHRTWLVVLEYGGGGGLNGEGEGSVLTCCAWFFNEMIRIEMFSKLHLVISQPVIEIPY